MHTPFKLLLVCFGRRRKAIRFLNRILMSGPPSLLPDHRIFSPSVYKGRLGSGKTPFQIWPIRLFSTTRASIKSPGDAAAPASIKWQTSATSSSNAIESPSNTTPFLASSGSVLLRHHVLHMCCSRACHPHHHKLTG